MIHRKPQKSSKKHFVAQVQFISVRRLATRVLIRPTAVTEARLNLVPAGLTRQNRFHSVTDLSWCRWIILEQHRQQVPADSEAPVSVGRRCGLWFVKHTSKRISTCILLSNLLITDIVHIIHTVKKSKTKILKIIKAPVKAKSVNNTDTKHQKLTVKALKN